MTSGKELTTNLTVLGKVPNPPAVDFLIGRAMMFLKPDKPVEKKESSVKPLNKDGKDCVKSSLEDKRDV